MLLSKKEFAESCGVRLSTLYNWISANRAGIRDYINEGMIESAIFDKQPFKQMQINRAKSAPEESTALKTALEAEAEAEAQTTLQAEFDQMKIRVQELVKENGILSATVSANQALIEQLNARIAGLEADKEALKADKLFLQSQIPPALPEPQGFFDRLFRRKKQ